MLSHCCGMWLGWSLETCCASVVTIARRLEILSVSGGKSGESRAAMDRVANGHHVGASVIVNNGQGRDRDVRAFF